MLNAVPRRAQEEQGLGRPVLSREHSNAASTGTWTSMLNKLPSWMSASGKVK